MNQRQIQAFRAVMQHGSITGAAVGLNVSQPAVSRLIADLEHELGFALLLRGGGRVQPTTEAYEFIQEVDRLFYGIDRLKVVAEEIRDLRRATFRVATLPMVAFEIVPSILKAFVTAHQGIRVVHDVHASGRVIDLVTSRQIDLGIAQIQADRRDLDVIAAYRSACVCAMAPDHPLAHRTELGPHDLDGVPLVALAHHTLTASHLARCFADAGVVPRIAAETQPSYSACGLAAIGLGVAIVDPITSGLFGARLAVVPFAPEIPFDFQIVKAKDAPLSRAARSFVEIAEVHIAALSAAGMPVRPAAIDGPTP